MKRQRGRNRNSSNNNNKNSNPNRSLDSNGPDVKVRGSASHIYEKYVTLARDATSSGHRVKAENYLQHAEHYLRIVNTQEAAKQAARAEREAREAAQQANQKTDDDSEDGRNNRRGQNRSRHNNQNDTKVDSENGKAAPQSETPPKSIDAGEKPKRQPRKAKADSKIDIEPEGLEVVEPKASADTIAEETPKRRRRAPARKKTDDSVADTAVDAAE